MTRERASGVPPAWRSSATATSLAAPRAVWDILLDGRRWSFWNPGVEWMWIEGEPRPGTLVTIKLKGVRQTAFVIEEIDAPNALALRLTIGPIARLQLRWALTGQDSGTHLECGIAIAGIASGLLLKRPAQKIAAALPDSLARLAERAARDNHAGEPGSV